MDWKAISDNVLPVGLFIGMETMFNQFNGRLDSIRPKPPPVSTPRRRRCTAASTSCRLKINASTTKSSTCRVSSRGALSAFKKKPVSVPQALNKHTISFVVGRGEQKSAFPVT